MCFSAGASFGASAILLGAGASTLSQTRSRSEWAFGSIPLFFAVQQFSEGLLWLALTNPLHTGWEGVSTHVFIFFAQIFWPAWIPFSVWLMEKRALRKKVLQIFFTAGVLLAGFMVFSITRFGVEAAVESCHIRYRPQYPFGIVRTVLYAFIVLGPFFVSSYKKMTVFGIGAFVTLVISILFYKTVMVSVWCFFAAIISLLIWWILYQNREKT